MKGSFSLFIVLTAAFILLACSQGFAQEKTPVKVKSTEVVTGVVIVHLQKGANMLELQCNEGAGTCKILPSGNYLMVQLPENHGMYDCKNVEIYRGTPEREDAAEKLGAYCLIDK